MKIILPFLFLVTSFWSSAQIPQPQMLSLKCYGGNSTVASNVMLQRDGGFVISIGSTTNGSNLDSFCSLSGNRAVFLKYNADASVLEWKKCYRDNFDDSSVQHIYSTADGNFLAGGQVYNDFHHKLFLRKEDLSGATLWRRTYGDSSEAIMRSMVATHDGGYIIAGVCNYTDVDFPTHYGGWTTEDIAVIRIDSNGNKIWSKVLGGTGIDAVTSVIGAPGDGCYIVGWTASNDFNFTSSHGDRDGYLIRLDKSGNIVWTRCLGGTGDDAICAACSDGKGGLIVAGRNSSTDGDIHVSTSFGCPVWVLNIDSNKNTVWNNCFGGADSLTSPPNSICLAVDGTIWIAGASKLPGNFVSENYGNEDAWFVHISNTGEFINAKVMGSDRVDRAMMVYPLSNNNVIAGGFCQNGTGTFNGLFSGSPGSDNAFLTVFSPGTNEASQVISEKPRFKIYPNPVATTEKINIVASERSECTAIISDMLGNKIYIETFNGTLQIRPKSWKEGIYLVQLICKDGYREVRKVIIK